MGITSKILEILESLCLGPYFFNIGIMLRNAVLVNGMIFNAEAWYNISHTDVEKLESIDKLLLCKMLQVPKTTPKEAMYL